VVTLNITAAPDTSANSFAGAGASAADPFTYTVVANSAPTLDSNVPDQSLTEDTNVTGAFDLDTYFSDVDTEHNDQYTCTAANDLAVGLGTMTINANRTVDFTLAANANGTDTIQFSCEDDATAAVSSNVITVTVAAVNDTPTLASNIPNITVTEDTTSTAAVDLDTYFTDVDTGDTCTYSVLDDWSKGTMTVNGDGTVDFVPTANTIGDDTIKFRCTDDSSATADTNSITVTITNTNDAPSITGLADISIAEGTTLVVLAQGVDVDSSTLSLAAADGDGSFTAKGYTVSELFSDNGDSTGTFTWTPGYTDAGAYPLGVTANDGITTASASMTITVTPANSDPEFDETNPLPNLAMVKGTPATDVFDLDDYFTDLDEETLTYSVIGNTNITATFNEGSVTLEATSAGTESLIFVATDAAGETANSNTIVVTVAAGVTLDGIDHIIGSNTKKGKIKLYNEEGEIIAQWKAFPKGGVVPRIAEIDGEGYVFAVKRRFGSTMHAYNLSGDEVLKKHRLSPKLHWRKLATGNVDSDKTDEEIVVMTERGSTLYFKIFSFNATKKKFTLKKKSKYRGKVIADQKYTASVVKKQVRLSDKDGNVIFVWTPYENTLSASMLRR